MQLPSGRPRGLPTGRRVECEQESRMTLANGTDRLCFAEKGRNVAAGFFAG